MGEQSGRSLTSNTETLLAAEVERHDAAPEVLFADDLLPGVGGEDISLRDGLAKGGSFTFVVLLLLNSLDELENSIFNVLGPDIRDSLGVSDGVIVFLSTSSAAFFVLGAVPFGWLADRFRRAPIVGIATLVFGGFQLLTALAGNAFALFWTRLGGGISKANTITVHQSITADAYPIEIRGRLSSVTVFGGRLVSVFSPLLAGIIADAAGADGWRWAFVILALPVSAMAILAFFIPEPKRGQWEQAKVLNEVLESDAIEPSIEAAFARLWRIQTIKLVIIAFAAMGFYLFSGQSIMYLYLEDHFGLSATERGVVGSLLSVGVVIVVLPIGRYFDRTFRHDPAKAVRLLGFLLLPNVALIPLQYAMPSIELFVVVGIVSFALSFSAFSIVGPVTQAVVPYRLRGMGSALITLWIFLVGGVGGALVGAFMTDVVGQRATVTSVAVPGMLIGSLMLWRGSISVKSDMSMIVAELREEMEEQERQQQRPEDIPALQVNHIDFSYGPVQVLFDMSFEVGQGETLALLGTNGAGKSTILRVITGLETPERGVVRHHGRTITFTTPERRAKMGIQMLPGGKGVFRNLSIADNLIVGAYQYRSDQADVDRRIARVLETFPALAGRGSERAGDLSGGQQQMLALARVMLHEPDILVIDELSLGLAPSVVQELIAMVEQLKAAGQTMIIVEQSLNVALAISDRAVFLEKGQVRFEGPASELAARDDLARAVFLGTEGG